MKDPKRIRKVLDRIEKVWTEHPDLRLGQLLVNVIPSTSGWLGIEDEALAEAIETWAKKQTMGGDPMSDQLVRYREFERHLLDLRGVHGGQESSEEDALLAEMDDLWSKLSENEKSKLG